MNKETKQLYEDYKFAKHNVQLEDAFLVKMDISMQEDFIEQGNYEKIINLAVKLEKSNSNRVDAFLKTIIEIKEENEEKAGVVIEIIYKGIFSSLNEVTEQDLVEFAKIQTVPQLLPYIRTTVASISSLMPIDSIHIPTIDVLETIKINKSKDKDVVHE